MKKLFAFTIMLYLFIFSAIAQPGLDIAKQHRAYIDSLLATVGINQHTIATGILYDRAPAIANLQGFLQSDVVSKGKFMQAALELRNSAYDTLAHHTIDQLRGIAEHYTYRRNIAPIGISFNRITYIDTLAVEKGLIIIDGQGRPRPTGRLKSEGLLSKEIFMTAVLWDGKELEMQQNFILPTELIMGNTKSEIATVEIDFGDGQGFRSVSPNTPVEVSYNTHGSKTIVLKTTTIEGEESRGYSTFDVKNNDIEFGAYKKNYLRRETIYADIPFAGSNGTFQGMGWVTYLYRYADKKLRKPVLIVDGFDPGNNNKDEDIFFTYLNNEDTGFLFANELHALGYDLVILDFPKAANENILEQVCVEWDEDEFGYYCSHWGWQPKVIDAGADYIQRNAFTAVKVIETLNQQLQQNGSNEELVVVGPSMGGLITRYALRYMELEPDLNHNTRLWVSFDSPHKGANIPIGLQQFINYFNPMSYGAWYAKEFMLNSKAARQMLIHHVNSNSEIPTGDPGWNPAWQSELASIGFPQQPRRVAISNGSLNGTSTGTPGSKAFYMQANKKNTTNWRAKSEVYNTGSYNARTKVFWGNTLLPLDEETKYARGLAGSYSLDNSPGGTRNSYETLEGMVTSDDYDFEWNILQNTHVFIPTKSGLAFTGSGTDLKETLYNRNLVATGETPFHNYWGPINKNMPHIAFDNDLMCWVLSEINGNPMSPKFDNKISGPTIVCTSNTTFTLNNLPAGSTVSWSHSSNLAYVSGQGTPSCTVKATSLRVNGAGWVQALVSTACGSSAVTHNVWVGTPTSAQPVVNYQNGLNVVCQRYAHTAEVPAVEGVTEYQWRLLYPDGFSWPLSSTSRIASFCVDTVGYFTIGVKQRMEGCSWSGEAAKPFWVEACGGGGDCGQGGIIVPKLIVSPNPVSYELTIAEVEPANDHIPWTLRLMSGQGAVMVNVTATLPKTLSVQNLQPGVYVLHARRGQHSEQQVIVVR